VWVRARARARVRVRVRVQAAVGGHAADALAEVHGVLGGELVARTDDAREVERDHLVGFGFGFGFGFGSGSGFGFGFGSGSGSGSGFGFGLVRVSSG
jgi:hypothetical protein